MGRGGEGDLAAKATPRVRLSARISQAGGRPLNTGQANVKSQCRMKPLSFTAGNTRSFDTSPAVSNISPTHPLGRPVVENRAGQSVQVVWHSQCCCNILNVLLVSLDVPSVFLIAFGIPSVLLITFDIPSVLLITFDILIIYSSLLFIHRLYSSLFLIYGVYSSLLLIY